MISNLIGRLGQNFVFLIIGVLVMPIFYKAIGPENLGLIAYIDSFATLGAIIAGFGVAKYGTREVAKSLDDQERTIYSVVTLRKVSKTAHIFINLIYLSLYFVLDFNESNFESIIFFISFISLNRNLLNVDWYYEAKGQFKLLSIKNVTVKVITISLLSLIYFFKDNIVFEFYFFTAGYAFVSFFVTYAFFKISIRTSEIRRGSTKKYFSLIFPTLLLSNSYFLFLQLDKMFLGQVSVVENGYYAMAERLAMLIFQIIMTLVVVSLPELGKEYYKKDNGKYYEKLKEIFSLTWIIITPITFGIWLCSDYLVFYFGGEDFMPASIVVKLFSILIFFLAFWRVIASNVFFLTGNESKCLSLVIIAGLINFLIKLFLDDLTAYRVLLITLFLHFFVVISLCVISQVSFRIKIPIFKFSYLKYIFASTLFFPIKYLVLMLGFNIHMAYVVIAFLCVFSYFTVLYFLFSDSYFRKVINGR